MTVNRVHCDWLMGALVALMMGVVPGTRAEEPTPTGLLEPEDFVYQGSFRFPEEALGDSRFGNGGLHLAFNPKGDPSGEPDGYPGSLYSSGHPYEQLVAELSIPAPAISQNKQAEDLPVARVLHPFADVTGGKGFS